MNIVRKVRTLCDKIKNGHFDYPLSAISVRLPDWLFYYDHSLIINSEQPKLISRNFTKYFKKFVSYDDLDILEKYGYSKDLVKSRLNAGDKAVIMGDNNEIMTIIWGASERKFAKLAGITLDPGKNGLLVYGGYTNEEARLKGLFPTAFSELYDYYKSQGRNRIWSTINVNNINSIKLHKRMNFDVYGETIYVMIFGIKISYKFRWPDNDKRFRIYLKNPIKKMAWM